MTQNNEREALIAKKELLEDLIKRMKGVYSEYHKEIVSDELTDTLESINNLTPISQNEQQEPIALLALKNTELNRRIEVLEDLLASAAVISLRRGEDTHWDRFIAQLKIKGICFVTPKTFKILPSDEEYTSPPKQMPEGWKPIETVPKDGTQVIIKCSGGRVATAFYDDKQFVGEGWHVVVPFLGGVGSGTDTFIYLQEDMPTHWMPLPTPTNTEVGE